MISILESRENEIKEYQSKLDQIVNCCEKEGSRIIMESELIVLQSNLDHLQTLIRSYEIETRNIQNRKRARLYRTNAKEYNKYLKQVRKDINWISAHARKRTGSAERGEYSMNGVMNNEDKAISYGRKLQLETENIADRTIKDLEATKDVAIDTALMVNDQSQQIAKIDQGLAGIDSEMDRATKKIKQIARRVLTDKYVNCLLIFILLAIVSIVVLHFFDVGHYVRKVRV